jgi:uncharacterized protein YukJ
MASMSAKHKKPKPPPKKAPTKGKGSAKNHGIPSYGVLKGKAVAGKLEGAKPHYQIHVKAAGVDHRIAVNVMSDVSPSELLFFLDPDFHHPLLGQLPVLAQGFHGEPKQAGGVALDFIRGNLFSPEEMKIVPLDRHGAGDDLHQIFELHVQQAIARGADVYAFGSKWGPEKGKPDQYFGFEPGNGIHDIHMNQGNEKGHAQDNGVWQDGGLFLHFADENRWLAFFLAFQSQSFHTDDVTGNAITGQEKVPVPKPAPAPAPAPGAPPAPAPVSPSQPGVSIVAALINPGGADVGKESVTLLNLTPDAVDLAGWSLADNHGQALHLTGPHLGAGDTVRITLSGQDVQLSNQGGTLTLLDPNGLKVHGVAFTQSAAALEGWSIGF